MSKFSQWYTTYSNEITWFIIGMCVTGGIDSLIRGQFIHATISFAVAYLNYALNRR
jgi:hypothetical protein